MKVSGISRPRDRSMMFLSDLCVETTENPTDTIIDNPAM